MEKVKYYLLVVGLLFFVACKDDDEDDNRVVPSTQFMKDAASSGKFEVATSKLALQRATNSEVIAFATQMVNDHTMANNELKVLAAQKSVALPDTFDTDKQQRYQTLSQKTGVEFDKTYMDQMVMAHDMDVEKFESASRNADDVDVKAWAAKTLPTLRMHQSHARTLEQTTNSFQ